MSQAWTASERLALLEAHPDVVRATITEFQENLALIDYKIDRYRTSVAAGDADRLWSDVLPET